MTLPNNDKSLKTTRDKYDSIMAQFDAYGFENETGYLTNCVDFQDLVRQASDLQAEVERLKQEIEELTWSKVSVSGEPADPYEIITRLQAELATARAAAVQWVMVDSEKSNLPSTSGPYFFTKKGLG